MFSATPYLTKPKPGVMLNPLHPLSQGLVGYWLFNEGTGSRANDISGKGNHGTLKNMSTNAQDSGWGGNKFGGGLNFDANNDYVNCGQSGNFTSEDFTLNARIYIRSFSGYATQPVLFFKGQYNQNGYYVQLNYTDVPDKKGVKFQTNQFGATQSTYTDADILPFNEWLFLTCVRQGSRADLYVDGVDVTNTRGNHVDPASSSHDFLVSQYDTVGNNYRFDGAIDSVCLHNRALSAAEVKQLYEDPFCNLLRPVPVRYVPAAVGGLPIPVAMNYYRRRRIA